MFVPAHNQKLLDSAVRRDADVLLLDIEDSVPFAEKQLSRDNIKNFVKRPDLHGKLLFPRVRPPFFSFYHSHFLDTMDEKEISCNKSCVFYTGAQKLPMGMEPSSVPFSMERMVIQ